MLTRKMSLGLWMLAGGMALLALLWQIRHPPRPPVAPPMPPVELPVAAPLEAFRLPPPNHYGIVARRPLFIAERRPEPPPPPEDAPPEPTPPPSPEQKFVVFGVLLTPGAQAALLRLEEPNAKPTRVRVGEQIGEWRLERISPQGVALRKGAVLQELPLTRPRRPGGPPVRPRTAQPSLPGAPLPGAPMPGVPMPMSVDAAPGPGMSPGPGSSAAQPAPVATP